VYYRTQVLWYLDVFGLDLAHVAVLIGGSEYREYQVTASPEEAAFMRERAVEFLGTVERRERPSIDEHDQTYQVIRDLHPDIEDVSVEVPAGIALPYLAANANYKDAEAAKRCAGSVLADFMGSARRATWAGDQIAMRISKGGGVPFLQAVSHKASGQKVSAV
jgi:peptidoglycan/xylan/chitin deacetylase (PgdA/CDA1 family)